MIDPERLILEFKTLLSIDNPSGKEASLAYYLSDLFSALGYRCFFDRSGEHTGSNVGNLIVHIPGTIPAKPIFFCAHLDSVPPCEGVEYIDEDGLIRSAGKTVLTADDKAGIAVLVELGRVLAENKFPYPPIELIFTTSEEVGLLGAKYLDYTLMSADEGFVLDSENPEEVINQAPSSYQYRLAVKGKSAHAGLEPEKGINAIKILALILSSLPTGRIDHETTANIGKIQGGTAVNIVPEFAEALGEFRSHSEEKIEELKRQIENTVKDIFANLPKSENGLPKYYLKFDKVFQGFQIPEDDPLCQLVKRAGERIGLSLTFKKKEGGSDANVFNANSKRCLILGVGMQKVHTKEEFIRKRDLINSARLVLEIVKLKGELSS